MLEALLAATATSGLFVLARGQRRLLRNPDGPAYNAATLDNGDDLPCPWCYSQTAETDTRCTSCGRRFG